MNWLFEPGAPDELVEDIYMHTLTLAIVAAIQRAPKARVTWPQDDEIAAHVMTVAVPPQGGVPVTGGHRAAATDAAPEDRSCLDLRHLYLEELRRILASEKPRAWPRGIQWIIDYTETHPVGVHRGAAGGAKCRNARRLSESAARHATARSESSPSKYPRSSNRKSRRAGFGCVPGSRGVSLARRPGRFRRGLAARRRGS